jgi:comEA protein
MKAMHLFLAVLFTCTLCLSAASGEVFAATDKKQENIAADTTTTTPQAQSDEKKKVAKIKKEIPENVDINSADKALLTALPGIGPVTADAILAYRQDNGKFKSIDELTKVKGIGDKTLAKLKPYLQTI